MDGELPDCPACHAAETLEAVAPADARGLRLCECSCCSKICRVDAAGEVVKKSILYDVVKVDGKLA
jgi:hypothetical protein